MKEYPTLRAVRVWESHTFFFLEMSRAFCWQNHRVRPESTSRDGQVRFPRRGPKYQWSVYGRWRANTFQTRLWHDRGKYYATRIISHSRVWERAVAARYFQGFAENDRNPKLDAQTVYCCDSTRPPAANGPQRPEWLFAVDGPVEYARHLRQLSLMTNNNNRFRAFCLRLCIRRLLGFTPVFKRPYRIFAKLKRNFCRPFEKFSNISPRDFIRKLFLEFLF